MDLLRKIVLFLEEHDNIDSYSIDIEDYDPDEIAYHCLLLKDQSLVDHLCESYHTNKYEAFFIRRLTAQGHDFAKSIRDESQWKIAKSILEASKSFTMPALISLLSGMTKTGLETRWGQALEALAASGLL